MLQDPQIKWDDGVSTGICVCMRSSLQPVRLNGFCLHSAFKCLYILDLCPVDINILAPIVRAFQMSPRNKMAIFSKTALMILIEFQ
jgi:hypothetical protein